MKPEVIVCRDDAELSRKAARELIDAGERAIAERGRFVVSLAGGKSPRRTYELLAAEYSASPIWKNTLFTVGDERCVPRDHEHSNQKMFWESFFSKIGATRERVLEPVGPEITAEVSDEAIHRRIAATYDRALNQALGFGSAHDVVFLGMGPDGHTASLFPPAAEGPNVEPLYIATHAPPTSPIHRRVTLTYGAIRAAREVWLLVTGKDKGEVLSRALKGDQRLPISKVLRDRTARLFIDEEISQWINKRTSA